MTSDRLKLRPLSRNEIGRIAQDVREEEGRKEWGISCIPPYECKASYIKPRDLGSYRVILGSMLQLYSVYEVITCTLRVLHVENSECHVHLHYLTCKQTVRTSVSAVPIAPKWSMSLFSFHRGSGALSLHSIIIIINSSSGIISSSTRSSNIV